MRIMFIYPQVVRLDDLAIWLNCTYKVLSSLLRRRDYTISRYNYKTINIGRNGLEYLIGLFGEPLENKRGNIHPALVRAARECLGLSRSKAAALIGKKYSFWLHAEKGYFMPSGLWELFCLRTGRHDKLKLVKKEPLLEKEVETNPSDNNPSDSPSENKPPATAENVYN
jgi:hypothetical protein